MFYLLVYTFTNLARFIVIIVDGRATRRRRDRRRTPGWRSARRGWRWRWPSALLSLAGLPPLAGFFAKLYLFWAAWRSGLWWLVLAGVLNSVISLFYYARIIRNMYLTEPFESWGIPSRSGSASRSACPSSACWQWAWPRRRSWPARASRRKDSSCPRGSTHSLQTAATAGAGCRG